MFSIMPLLTLALLIFAMFIAIIKRDDKSSLGSFLLFILLVLLAGLRDGSSMPDYHVYVDYYHEVTASLFNPHVEPSIYAISKLASYLFGEDPKGMFLIYALLGVGLKWFSLKKLSPLFFFSIVVYISNYFILNEMIQIRAGVASGIILLSIIPLYERHLGRFLFFIACATLFHYSAIIAVFLWFIPIKSFNKQFYIIAIFAAYIIYLLNINVLNSFFESISSIPIFERMGSYSSMERRDRFEITPFGPFALSRLVICLFMIRFSHQISKHYKYANLLLKMYLIGFISYVVLTPFPEFAVRICQLLMTTEICLIPCLIYIVRPLRKAKVYILLYALLSFVTNVMFTTYFSFSL